MLGLYPLDTVASLQWCRMIMPAKVVVPATAFGARYQRSCRRREARSVSTALVNFDLSACSISWIAMLIRHPAPGPAAGRTRRARGSTGARTLDHKCRRPSPGRSGNRASDGRAGYQVRGDDHRSSWSSCPAWSSEERTEGSGRRPARETLPTLPPSCCWSARWITKPAVGQPSRWCRCAGRACR